MLKHYIVQQQYILNTQQATMLAIGLSNPTSTPHMEYTNVCDLCASNGDDIGELAAVSRFNT